MSGPTAHLIGGQVHRLQPAATKPVDRQARNGLVEARGQNRRAREAPALFAHLGHIAPDDILDRMAGKSVPRGQSVQHLRGQRHRRHLVQAAVRPAAAAGRADRVIDESLGHGNLTEQKSGSEKRAASGRKGAASRAMPQSGPAKRRYGASPRGQSRRVQDSTDSRNKTGPRW